MSDGTLKPEHEAVCNCPNCTKMKALIDQLFLEIDKKNNQLQSLMQQLHLESLEVRGEQLRRAKKRPDLALSACASASIA